MHRSYEGTNSPIMVYWFDDRIEIINAGGLFGRMTPENFGRAGFAGLEEKPLRTLSSKNGSRRKNDRVWGIKVDHFNNLLISLFTPIIPIIYFSTKLFVFACLGFDRKVKKRKN